MTEVLGEFGNRLRLARSNAGVSQSQLEARARVPKTMLSRYENGHVSPSIETLMRICSALSITPNVLLAGKTDPSTVLLTELARLGVTMTTEQEARTVAREIAQTRVPRHDGGFGLTSR